MERSENVRDTILGSAEHLFGRLGYDKTSVDDIAGLSHKAKTSIYYYFDSKKAIFSAVLDREFSSLKDSLSEITGNSGEKEEVKLYRYLLTRMEKIQGMEVYKRYIMASFSDRFASPMADMVDRKREKFDRWEYDYFCHVGRTGCELGIFPDKVKPDAFAKLLVTLLKGLEIQFFIHNDYDAMKSTYESLADLLIFRNPNFGPEGR